MDTAVQRFARLSRIYSDIQNGNKRVTDVDFEKQLDAFAAAARVASAHKQIIPQASSWTTWIKKVIWRPGWGDQKLHRRAKP